MASGDQALRTLSWWSLRWSSSGLEADRSHGCWLQPRWAALSVLVASATGIAPAGATTTTTTMEKRGGILWPDTPALDADGVRYRAKEACTSLAMARLQDGNYEKAVENDAMPAVGESSVLAQMLNFRSRQGKDSVQEMAKVFDACSATVTDAAGYTVGDVPKDDPACGAALKSYLVGLAFPFAAPLACALLSASLHYICCWVACCRCCRRQVCCMERVEAYKASRVRILIALILWAGACAGIFSLGSSVHELSLTTHAAVSAHICAAARLARDAVGGSDAPRFLGTEIGVANLQALSQALDVDQSVMRLVSDVIDKTEIFAARQQGTIRRIEHFVALLRTVGGSNRVFEHRCVFCSLALGSPSRLPGVAAVGLLTRLQEEIGGSAMQAMLNIRTYAQSRLMGSNLTSLASRVKRATASTVGFDRALHELLVETWPRQQPSVYAIEAIRLVIFGVLGVLAMLGAISGVIAFVITHIRMKRRPDFFPSGKLHLCTWCCGFFYATLAFLLGGCLLLVAMVAGEACVFARLDIFSAQMVAHLDALHLRPMMEDFESGAGASKTVIDATAALTAQIAQSCFTPNGTGDLLQVLGLDQALSFQSDISQSFSILESRVSEPPAGQETAKTLVSLSQAAIAFGNVFVLDPFALENSTGPSNTLGLLELGSNVKQFMFGSGVAPEDMKGPDGVQTIIGLNSYAALIAGPGKYTFAHGTAGGGFVVTGDRPTDVEMQNLDVVVRNALLYARAKEHLLTSNATLRCDLLDDEGVVTERLCTLPDFYTFIADEVARIQQVVTSASQEAIAVKDLFLGDLSVELQPTLRKVRDIRNAFDCRFLWQRTQDLYGSLCEDVAPIVARGVMQLVALSCVTVVGIVVQYKVWRHLKDNKVVGDELKRFEAALASQVSKRKEQSREQRLALDDTREANDLY